MGIILKKSKENTPYISMPCTHHVFCIFWSPHLIILSKTLLHLLSWRHQNNIYSTRKEELLLITCALTLFLPQQKGFAGLCI